MSITNLPINKLQISEFNVRKNAGDISELAKSIGEKGIFQPLLVRPENGQYGIIIGSRRFAAAQKSNIKNLPVIIKEIAEDEALIISLADNIQRNDVEPKDAAVAVRTLLNDFHYTSRTISDELGKSQGYVMNLSTIENLIFKLEKIGVTVEVHADDNERETHKAVPIMHAVAVAKGFNRRSLLPRLEAEPEIDAEMAKKGSDLKQSEIINVMNYLEDNPNRSIDDAILEGKDYKRGSVGGGGSSGTSEGHVDSETKRWHNKLMWNLERNTTKYDFYTIGYSGTDIDLFIERLKSKNVKTLIDVRKNAFSLYKEDFSKDNLSQALRLKGISYEHFPEFGVDREERENLETIEDYQKLWKSYDKKVISTLPLLEGFLDYEGHQGDLKGPIAFMCSELDPTKCHRHRIAKAYEDDFGLKSMDL
jgi:ParB/RepB/Spo0J family partition protein